MTKPSRTFRPFFFALVLATGSAFAGAPDVTPAAAPAADDLTLGNFFSEGWTQPFEFRRSLDDGAPDLPLFHVSTNFLARASRTDYSFEENLNGRYDRNINYLDEYCDFAVNKRFMISVFGNYTWRNARTGHDVNGAGGGMFTRFQLIDTPTSSDSINLRVDLPNKDLGVHTTKLSETLAGWQDLSPLGVGRVGLYYSFENDNYAGYAASGSMRDDVAYDVALGKTWTSRSASVAALTTLVEFSGGTNMDGNQRTYTNMAATPAVEFIVGKHNLIMLGVDFPLTHPSAEREVYRATYIYLFF